MDAEPGATAIVDVIGIGAGVYDRLREQGVKVRPVQRRAARPPGTTHRPVRFTTISVRRAWWTLRELLDPPQLEARPPPDDELAGDLTALHYKHTSDGKIRVESQGRHPQADRAVNRPRRRGNAGLVLLSSGSWADAYGTMTCVNEKCGRPFMREANGKPRTECPFCHTPLDEPEGEAA